MATPKKQFLHNVLVVGGCGFLGHHVVKLLLEQHPECNVSVMDLHTSMNNFPSVAYYSGDITSREQVDEILVKSKPEVVIDTVSPVFGLGKEIYFKVNVDGTRTLLEASGDRGVRAFVYTSSASVVFDGINDMRNVNESAPIPVVPMDAYNETKVHLFLLETGNGKLTCASHIGNRRENGPRRKPKKGHADRLPEIIRAFRVSFLPNFFFL